MTTRLYNKLNEYYKEKFGERVLKICVDGGFTCPNRDGKVGTGGCIFCSERGSGEHIKFRDVGKQITEHLQSYRGQRANKFIVYFQNYSNTYAPIQNLKKIYDSALISDKIIGFSVATRPDCINQEIVDLLKSYTDKYYVSVELGLQTVDENIAKDVNLCYTVSDFNNAIKLLSNTDIEVVCHVMLGLPGETEDSITKTINAINNSNVKGIKIHNTYVVKNTELEKRYLSGNYKTLEVEEYLDKLAYVISKLRSNIIIHRISGDADKSILVAPQWNTHKKWVLNGLDKKLKENNLWQGKFYQLKE